VFGQNSPGTCWFWLQAGPQAEEGEGALLRRGGIGELVKAGHVVVEPETVLDQGDQLVVETGEGSPAARATARLPSQRSLIGAATPVG